MSMSVRIENLALRVYYLKLLMLEAVVCRLRGHDWFATGMYQRACERCARIEGYLTDEEYEEAHLRILDLIERYQG